MYVFGRKEYIARIPLIQYLTGFLTSFLMKPLPKYLGKASFKLTPSKVTFQLRMGPIFLAPLSPLSPPFGQQFSRVTMWLAFMVWPFCTELGRRPCWCNLWQLLPIWLARMSPRRLLSMAQWVWQVLNGFTSSLLTWGDERKMKREVTIL